MLFLTYIRAASRFFLSATNIFRFHSRMEHQNFSETIGNFSINSGCPWRDQFRKKESALIERWKIGGLFVDTDLEDINCYWLQFEPVPLPSHIILAFIFFAIFAVGSVSNALVIYIMTTSKHLKTPVNIIITNLALSDFIMLVKMPIFIYNSLVQGPALGYRACEVYGFLSGITGTSSIMSLAAIAFDRYLVINRPYKGNNSKPSLARSYITAVCIWLYSGIISSLPLFGIGKYVPEGYLTSCSFDYLSEDPTTQTFIFVFFIVAWVVPVSIIIGSYSAVLRYVSQNRHLVSRAVEIMSGTAAFENQQQQQEFICIDPGEENQRNGQDQQYLQQESRAQRNQRKLVKFELVIAKITASLVILWIVSWTPYAIVALIGISGYQNFLTPGLTMLPSVFAKISASINPFVYSLNHPKMRREMVRRFRCLSVYDSNAVSAASNETAGPVAADNGAQPHQHRNNHQGAGNRKDSPLYRFKSRIINSRTDCSSGSDTTSRRYTSTGQHRQHHRQSFMAGSTSRHNSDELYSIALSAPALTTHHVTSGNETRKKPSKSCSPEAVVMEMQATQYSSDSRRCNENSASRTRSNGSRKKNRRKCSNAVAVSEP